MAGGSGLAGLAVTGLVAALVAFGVSAILAPGAKPPSGAPEASKGDAELRAEVDRLRREVAELRASGAANAPGRASAASPTAPGAPTPEPAPADPKAPPAPDAEGPLPADRRELVALIDRRIAEGWKSGAGATAVQPRRQVTIEEAGGEMGLSAVDIDSIRRVWRDFELERVAAVMGTTDLEVIKDELKGAKDDPSKKEALVNKGIANVLRNVGRLATLEDRRKRDLKRWLTDEQIQKLKSYDIKSVLNDPELEEILKDVFD